MTEQPFSPLRRHIDACTNAILPGDRIPLHINTDLIGYLDPQAAHHLTPDDATATETGLVLNRPESLPHIARRLSDAGFGRHRAEAFDVRANSDGPVLTTIDRGALPVFGIEAQGIHLDAILRRPDGPHLWIARRAANKALDPGKLDHIVAGGIPAGLTPEETLIKEAAEEAGMPETLAARAVKTGIVRYAMTRPEGLRRDRLHCYELEIPEDFRPTPQDGEVAGFELIPLETARDLVRHTDDFKFNVNLVLMALFLRHGMLNQGETALMQAYQGRVFFL